ncbi:MAG: diguanylate cyclase [Actinobacteria bacterium]|nr:diguanylate cyclase [Actinomycetota bacterium]MCB9412368.1 diguanylate cyclase [Actinomycetota bacterium]
MPDVPAPSGTPASAHREAQPEILLVDDDPGAILLLGKVLGDMARLRFATTGSEALSLARHQRPDLVLLDIEMPGMSGLDVCLELKSDDAFIDVPIIFITSHHSQEDELAGLSAGAVDFIAKPPLAPLVRARVATHLRLKRFNDLLKQSALQDSVTGISNRRVFEEQLPKAWLRSMRENRPLSLFMIDIDYFKEYNDSRGHQAGDECLEQVARSLATTMETLGGLLARYGGDEFVLVAPDVDVDRGQQLAEALRCAVVDLNLQHDASPISEVVTASVGGATFVPDDWQGAFARSAADQSLIGPAHLLLAADRSLYTAKERGRNCAVAAALVPDPAFDRGAPVDPPGAALQHD